MKLLEGKKALIFGVANERSIAWGIAQALFQHGASIGLSYAGNQLEKRVRPLSNQVNCDFIYPCDVSNDQEIEKIASEAFNHFKTIDVLVHAIAFANRDELIGPYYNTTRVGFQLAMDISVYSFTALCRAFKSFITPTGSIITLTYYGSEKVFPHYNVMGVAKAALEASVRYLAYDFGKDGIRVNAISAGPIRTLAAAGVSGFKQMYRRYAEVVPLHKGVTIEDVGRAAVYLSSDLANNTTGSVLYVDSGYNILGISESIE